MQWGQEWVKGQEPLVSCLRWLLDCFSHLLATGSEWAGSAPGTTCPLSGPAAAECPGNSNVIPLSLWLQPVPFHLRPTESLPGSLFVLWPPTLNRSPISLSGSIQGAGGCPLPWLEKPMCGLPSQGQSCVSGGLQPLRMSPRAHPLRQMCLPLPGCGAGGGF